MLDINLLRNEPEKVRENIRKKFQDAKLPMVDEVIQFDKEYRAAQQQADALRNQRKQKSKMIGGLMAKGQKEEAEQMKAEVAAMEFAFLELTYNTSRGIAHLSSEISQFVPFATCNGNLGHRTSTLIEQAKDTVLTDARVSHITTLNLGGRLQYYGINRLCCCAHGTNQQHKKRHKQPHHAFLITIKSCRRLYTASRKLLTTGYSDGVNNVLSICIWHCDTKSRPFTSEDIKQRKAPSSLFIIRRWGNSSTTYPSGRVTIELIASMLLWGNSTGKVRCSSVSGFSSITLITQGFR